MGLRRGTERIRESVPARIAQPPGFAGVRTSRDDASGANPSLRERRERVGRKRRMRSQGIVGRARQWRARWFLFWLERLDSDLRADLGRGPRQGVRSGASEGRRWRVQALEPFLPKPQSGSGRGYQLARFRLSRASHIARASVNAAAASAGVSGRATERLSRVTTRLSSGRCSRRRRTLTSIACTEPASP